jgi:hypothetical protein
LGLGVRNETFDQSAKAGDGPASIAMHKYLPPLIKLLAVEPENGKSRFIIIALLLA